MTILIAFLIGGLLGYTITHLNYKIGFNHGWHKGVEDVIAVMEGENLNEY